ncbi:hypothetical protein TVAG_399510 [Trichomonas vaginalis G3]|uniref:Eukaryotic porin family protein n=1 Tax=Trichomonas vaginalis (strain ATCC PRA-98 / G3) TaxID=412133 RepID=A2E5Y9_TRIV3|nr:porin domain-containing protein [Trichomonas vaginalis G3]EAY11946.1 hypothetical protein TVAG_399510 [Trichomonas vaginalis G3]KAI5530389.1 porin domain-containing protein [Trichomonas vaginalis G3]|eukprot:XP_001324169.1 hypothetical protein [Trichomonas vaginalis G3]
MILESFSQVTSRDNAILELPYYPGLKLEASYNLGNDAYFHSYVSFRPLKISIVPGPNGQYNSIQNQTAVAYTTFKKTINKNIYLLTLGNQNSSFSLYFKQIPKVNIMSRFQIGDGMLSPAIKFSYLGKYIHPVIQISGAAQKLIDVQANDFKFYNFSLVNSMQISTTIGRPDLMLGVQYIKSLRQQGVYSLSTFVRNENEKRVLSLSFVKEDVSFVALQYIRKLKNWNFGISYAISTALLPYLTIASTVELGRSKVQTNVSDKLISSLYSYKVSDNMNFEICGTLNHKAKSYTIGLGFVFNPDDFVST